MRAGSPRTAALTGVTEAAEASTLSFAAGEIFHGLLTAPV